MDYLFHVMVMIEIYIILSVSLNLVMGYTGLVSIAQAAFYGIGAYTSALMALHLHTPFLLNMAGGMLVSAATGLLLAVPSLRLREDYFVIVTFAFQISFTIMESVFIVSIVIIGGAGSLWGSVIGACALVSLPEILRFVGLPDAIAAGIRQIAYGVSLVVLMIWRPRGLMGHYSLSRGSAKND